MLRRSSKELRSGDHVPKMRARAVPKSTRTLQVKVEETGRPHPKRNMYGVAMRMHNVCVVGDLQQAVAIDLLDL